MQRGAGKAGQRGAGEQAGKDAAAGDDRDLDQIDQEDGARRGAETVGIRDGKEGSA